jgi:hypothetical protein
MRRRHRLALVGLLLAVGTPQLKAQAAQEPLLRGHFALVLQNVRLLSNVRNRLPTALDANAGGIDLTLRLRDSRFAAQLYFVEMSEQAAGTGKYSSLAMTLLYGSETAAGELGVLRRPGHSPVTDVDLDQMYSALRLGGRGSTRLGTTPVTLGGRAAVYVPLGGSGKSAHGFDLETEVRWVAAKLPVGASIGYRFERFNVDRAEQELGAIVTTFSYVFGRSR